MRKDSLVVGEIYHIFTKSIAGFKIFNSKKAFLRMLNVICYYQRKNPQTKFSRLIRSSGAEQKYFDKGLSLSSKDKLAEIIAYCIMPTHMHLILKQLKKDGISILMKNALNSYTRYFNTKYKRKGPLWEGRFKNVLVKNDEQLLHLTRYIHLNPVTARFVNKPENWTHSSYREYLGEIKDKDKVCKYDDILDVEPTSYGKFVEDRISYQRELAVAKNLFLE